ncbi:MAG: acetyl esterase/lipase [Saprospiraceae bacterium]|jgi:acetyl esterase/lipase
MQPKIVLLFLFFLYTFSLAAQKQEGNYVIKNHFDSTSYISQDIEFQSFAEKQDGYWLFTPKTPKPDTAHVLVFLHGYGGYNPMIYGKWLKHLVKQGNIVIYPRYQKNLRVPKPDKFAINAAYAIQNAKKELESREDIVGLWEDLTFAGHSYGGVISADLAANFVKYDIPQPKAIMLVSPGTAYLKKGRLESYEGIPIETKVLITVSNDDKTTRDEFGILVYETAVNTTNRVLYRQFADAYSPAPITAGHNESYSVDLDFDAGLLNYTAKRALRISKENALDYNGYWRLFDALIACQREGKDCDLAFGKEGFDLGEKENGESLSSFKVSIPK